MKKLISTVLAAALTLSLAACGSTAASSTSEAASGSEAASTASSETASDASDAVDFTGDGYDATVDYASLAGTTIKVAASPVPHAEILKVAGDILAKADITLDVVEYTDYVQPNLVTESGEVDANYFQHGPYLEDFNEKNNTHLVSVAAIHYEPFGLYPGKTKSLDDLADGAKIAVPNDATNEARALQLLAAQGIITLKEDAGLAATKNDVVESYQWYKDGKKLAAETGKTLTIATDKASDSEYYCKVVFANDKLNGLDGTKKTTVGTDVVTVKVQGGVLATVTAADVTPKLPAGYKLDVKSGLPAGVTIGGTPEVIVTVVSE